MINLIKHDNNHLNLLNYLKLHFIIHTNIYKMVIKTIVLKSGIIMIKASKIFKLKYKKAIDDAIIISDL